MGVRVVDKTELLAMLANVSDYGRFHWTNQKLVDCITRVLENEGVKKDPPLCCVLQKKNSAAIKERTWWRSWR